MRALHGESDLRASAAPRFGCTFSVIETCVGGIAYRLIAHFGYGRANTALEREFAGRNG
jgi:hypothetical protein